MQAKAEALVNLRFLLSFRQHFLSFPRNLPPITSKILRPATYSTISLTQVEKVAEEITDHRRDSSEIFRRWGCTDNDIERIFFRRPSLRKTDLNQLQSKLNVLRNLGVTAPDLLKIINCRPRFLSCTINNSFNERIEFFTTLFESREVLLKAIVRNPSLLTYDFHNKIKPAISLYERMGVNKKDLILMLLSRPTLIPRTSFDDEKMEYIRKTRVSKDDKMYKYVVTLIGISRVETIRKKLANFEKFGFSDDEILGLFGKSPLLLTLSVDKVQRNMTFILCTLKLAANVVLQHPFLLYSNLEAKLRPRVLLAGKMEEMGIDVLQIRGPTMLRALRMTDRRFVKAFVNNQPKDIADELMEFYRNAKGVKRFGQESKKNSHPGFPF